MAVDFVPLGSEGLNTDAVLSTAKSAGGGAPVATGSSSPVLESDLGGGVADARVSSTGSPLLPEPEHDVNQVCTKCDN